MACELWSREWSQKLDLYLDGELEEKETQAVREHLRTCPACAADALDRMMVKRSVKNAGARFRPGPAFRARVAASIAAPDRAKKSGNWRFVAAFAVAAIVVAALSATYLQTRNREKQLVSELVDLHVATLASPNPVDVVSSDRHTVKPWFTGKLPFTFDVPELQGTLFTLVGARESYLEQSAGAELIFRIRQHNISVFIFQERALGGCAGKGQTTDLNFHIESWSQNSLCYFAVSDVNADDLGKLAALMKH
jgi:anti-sigma factor RsiW